MIPGASRSSIHSAHSSEGDLAALLSSMVNPTYSGARVPSLLGQNSPIHEGTNDTNEFVSHVLLSPESPGTALAVVRVSMLGAGFLCGVGGRNINAIQHRTGVTITSSVSKTFNGNVRVFKVSASNVTQVKSAVAIMQEAVGVYKSLTEGDFRGQYVEPDITIQGIMFSYAPPPKDKMPHAACVRKLSQSLARRKDEMQSTLSGLSSRSSLSSHSSHSSLLSNHSYQTNLEWEANSSVDSNDGFAFGASLHGDQERDCSRWGRGGHGGHGGRGGHESERRVESRADEHEYAFHRMRIRGHQQDVYPHRGFEDSDHGRHAQHVLGRNLDKDLTRVRQYPPSPYTPSTSEKEPTCYRHLDRSGLPMGKAYSTPRLSGLTPPPAPDRADGDWRARTTVDDKGPRPRSLLKDFQRMGV